MDPIPQDFDPESPFSRSLNELVPGDCAIIRHIQGREEHQRLMSMGVCEGRFIELVQKGNPLVLRVFGTRIGLSGRLADQIHVELCHRGTRCPISESLTGVDRPENTP